MPAALSRGEIARNNYTLPQAVQEELERLREEGELGDGAKTEPRCYVCCEAESKELVNKMLAGGMTNREIAESCKFINKRRQSVGDTRTIDARNIWWHRREHFPVDEPAKAVYRTIAERHAENAHIDHINGVGTAVSPLAVLHTLMVKGYSDVTTGDMPVSVKDLITTVTKLHELTTRDAGQKKMADIMYQMDRILQAVNAVTTDDQQRRILEIVEGRDEAPLDQVVEKVKEVVREFAPATLRDEDDDL